MRGRGGGGAGSRKRIRWGGPATSDVVGAKGREGYLVLHPLWGVGGLA